MTFAVTLIENSVYGFYENEDPWKWRPNTTQKQKRRWTVTKNPLSPPPFPFFAS